MSALPVTVRSPGSFPRRTGPRQAADRGRLRMPASRRPRWSGSGCWAGSRCCGTRREIPLRAFGGRLPQQLLRLLALRAGRPRISKDAIVEALWPRWPPADASGQRRGAGEPIRRALGGPQADPYRPRRLQLTGGRASAGWMRRRFAPRPAMAAGCSRTTPPRRSPAVPRRAGALARRAARRGHLCGLGATGPPLPVPWRSMDALEGAAAAALACGDPAGASPGPSRATAREPLRESSAMLAARTLAAGGDQAGALAAFDSFGDRLAREAGLAPSPEALELRRRIQDRQPAPGEPEVTPPARPSPRRLPAARKSARPGWPGCPAGGGNCRPCWPCSACPPRPPC